MSLVISNACRPSRAGGPTHGAGAVRAACCGTASGQRQAVRSGLLHHHIPQEDSIHSTMCSWTGIQHDRVHCSWRFRPKARSKFCLLQPLLLQCTGGSPTEGRRGSGSGALEFATDVGRFEMLDRAAAQVRPQGQSVQRLLRERSTRSAELQPGHNGKDDGAMLPCTI